MNQNVDLYMQSSLALAAYANLDAGIINEQDLVDAGMTTKQASEFAKIFTVAAPQYIDGSRPYGAPRCALRNCL